MSQQCKFKNTVSQRVIVFCMLLYSHGHRLLPTLVKKNRTLTLNDNIIAISFESEKLDFMTVQICLNVQSLNEDFTGYQSHYPLSGGRYDCDFKSVCLNVTYGYEANVNLMVVLKPEDHQSHSDSSSGNHPSSGCRDISLEK